MTMNIRNDLGKRISNIIHSVRQLAEFQIRGSVQPTLDYDRIMDRVKTMIIPSTAGNVFTTITPEPNETMIISSAVFECECDGTAANRTWRNTLQDELDNIVYNWRNLTAFTANQCGGFVICDGQSYPGRIYHTESQPDQSCEFNYPSKLEIHGSYDLIFNIFAGQAGDAYEGTIAYKLRQIPRET